MKFNYIDAHSHLNSTEYDADREQVIARMQEAGIATITVGTTLADSKQAVALADKYENIFACIGVHPVDEQKETFDETVFAELVTHPKVVAIGECGLDYFRLEGESLEEKARQKQFIWLKYFFRGCKIWLCKMINFCHDFIYLE
jgi:TatD DNase family protein